MRESTLGGSPKWPSDSPTHLKMRANAPAGIRGAPSTRHKAQRRRARLAPNGYQLVDHLSRKMQWTGSTCFSADRKKLNGIWRPQRRCNPAVNTPSSGASMRKLSTTRIAFAMHAATERTTCTTMTSTIGSSTNINSEPWCSTIRRTSRVWRHSASFLDASSSADLAWDGHCSKCCCGWKHAKPRGMRSETMQLTEFNDTSSGSAAKPTSSLSS